MSPPPENRGTVENTATKADPLTPEQHEDPVARGFLGEFEILGKLGEGAQPGLPRPADRRSAGRSRSSSTRGQAPT